MTIRRTLTATAVVAFMATTAVSAFAQEGRLSLAERVARLEQQGQSQPAGGGASLELLNRLQDLQSELQTLRGMIEQQTFEIEELKKRQRDQYVDLDSRIERLSGGTPAGSLGADDTLDLSAPSGAATTPPPAIPATPPDPNQLQMEDAAPVDPYTGEPIRQDTTVSSPPPATGLGAAPAGGIAAGDPESAYQTAFDALKQGQYERSGQLFNEFVRTYPSHELTDNALYWLGESYYVTQNYDTALQTFRDLITRFPAGEKTPDAELKIGYCLYELGQVEEARAALNGVVSRYPDSTVARLADSRLRALAIQQR
jgi:tol-pal system protein YbgF